MNNITSRKNELIKQFKQSRNVGGVTVIEGAKLISEALDAGFVPKAALFTEKAVNKYPLLHTKLFERLSTVSVITDDISEYISDTKTPQGVFAMFATENNSASIKNFSEARKLLLLERVQDPVNVGAIIRSCEAFGLDGAVLEDCADIFGAKVLRASAGSALRLPCVKGELAEIIPKLKDSGFTVYAAALDETAQSLRGTDFPSKTAVVIGNEGNGITEKVLRLCDRKLYIPIKGAESLNAAVAAGIICWRLSDIVD